MHQTRENYKIDFLLEYIILRVFKKSQIKVYTNEARYIMNSKINECGVVNTVSIFYNACFIRKVNTHSANMLHSGQNNPFSLNYHH